MSNLNDLVRGKYQDTETSYNKGYQRGLATGMDNGRTEMRNTVMDAVESSSVRDRASKKSLKKYLDGKTR